MAVALAGGEAGGHAGLQKLLAGVGDEGELAFEHIDELVFMAVPVALRGGRAWRQAYQFHVEGIEAQRIAQRPLLQLAAGRSPGLRIGRAFAELDIRRIEQIARASCREKLRPTGEFSLAAVPLTNKKKNKIYP